MKKQGMAVVLIVCLLAFTIGCEKQTESAERGNDVMM